MTRELILQKLKTKLKDLGLSDAILGAQSDYLLTLTPTEETIDGLIGGIEPALRAFQSDLDKARSKAPIQTPPTPPQNPTPPATPPQGEQMPEWAKVLADSIKGLQNQQTEKTKSESLIAKLEVEKIPATFYQRFLKTVDFNNAEYDEVNTLEGFKTDFNTFKQDFANDLGNGGTPPIQEPQKAKAGQILSDIERLA